MQLVGVAVLAKTFSSRTEQETLPLALSSREGSVRALLISQLPSDGGWVWPLDSKWSCMRAG